MQKPTQRIANAGHQAPRPAPRSRTSSSLNAVRTWLACLIPGTATLSPTPCMGLCQCPERRVPASPHSPPRSSWAGFSSRKHASKSDIGSTCGRVIPSCPPMCGNRRAALGRQVGLASNVRPASSFSHLPKLDTGTAYRGTLFHAARLGGLDQGRPAAAKGCG